MTKAERNLLTLLCETVAILVEINPNMAHKNPNGSSAIATTLAISAEEIKRLDSVPQKYRPRVYR